MDSWLLVLLVFQLASFVAVVVIWAKIRKPQTDPRLSRGLQLLSSKISILEDLSGRTDTQVHQLASLLEAKGRQLQDKILEAERELAKIDQALSRTLEVAEVFQDRIPTEEFIERQNTIKYVMAARMAHEGCGIDEILERVDLPREQIEFIAKVNKDQLMFDEAQLPTWMKLTLERQKMKHLAAAQGKVHQEHGSSPRESQSPSESVSEELWKSETLAKLGQTFTVDQQQRLEALGAEFKQACENFDKQSRPGLVETGVDKVLGAAHKFTAQFFEKPIETSPESPDLNKALPEQAEHRPVQNSFNFAKRPPSPTTQVLFSDSSALSAKLKIREVPSDSVKKVLFPSADPTQ